MNLPKIRILIIGNSKAGKTSIINRIINHNFLRKTSETKDVEFHYLTYQNLKREIIKNKEQQPIYQGEIVDSDVYLIEIIDT